MLKYKKTNMIILLRKLDKSNVARLFSFQGGCSLFMPLPIYTNK